MVAAHIVYAAVLDKILWAAYVHRVADRPVHFAVAHGIAAAVHDDGVGISAAQNAELAEEAVLNDIPAACHRLHLAAGKRHAVVEKILEVARDDPAAASRDGDPLAHAGETASRDGISAPAVDHDAVLAALRRKDDSFDPHI